MPATNTAETESDLTRRAREVLAGLTKEQRIAFRRITYAVQFHSDRRWPRGSALHTWATSGPSSASERAAVPKPLLDSIKSAGLAVLDREGWNITDLGREVARLIAEGGR